MNKDIADLNLFQIKQGYFLKQDFYQCFFCDNKYLKGDIYTFDNRMVDAHKAVQLHIEKDHHSSFQTIIANDKKYTGLSKVQSDLMIYFYNDIPDKEIAEKTNTSASTVRYQRYHLREKAKQAKVFLALFELMEEKSKNPPPTPVIHEGATMIDERYMTTEEETEKIIKTYFSSQNPPILKSFPPREKKKIVILRVVAQQFQKDKRYSEKEVNTVLQAIYADFATIRRYLIEYGFMDRTKNCKKYWLC